MKMAFVCVEDGLMSVGFRKIAAFARTLHPDTSVRFIPYRNARSLKLMLLGRQGECARVSEDALREMAEPLAAADLVGFSSMTGYAALTADLIRHLRALNPRAYVVWGGIHPILAPEDAIRHADAVCTGEGEFALREFLAHFAAGTDYSATGNFWFRRDGAVVKNGFLPLMSNDELSALPLPHYGTDELIYEPGRGYVPVTARHYADYNGLSYNAVWSIGCPFRCTYCGNTKFIDNDKAYRKIRHPSVAYLMAELRQALRVHPHLSSVVFNDDSFLALPLRVLEEFAGAYKSAIGVPFTVQGVVPNYVRADKLEALLDAGLVRVRMGIQSGSPRMLEFYDRPTPPDQAMTAAETLHRYRRFMIPPAYDIIVDNPVETRADVQETLAFLDRLPRPYTLNVYSLRAIPNTELERRLQARGISIDAISASYWDNAPTLANCLVYLLATGRVPRLIFAALFARARALLEPQRHYPRLLLLCRGLFLLRRGLDHLRFMEFSSLTGRTAYWLDRIGVVRFWHRHCVPRFVRSSPPEQSPAARLPASG